MTDCWCFLYFSIQASFLDKASQSKIKETLPSSQIFFFQSANGAHLNVALKPRGDRSEWDKRGSCKLGGGGGRGEERRERGRVRAALNALPPIVLNKEADKQKHQDRNITEVSCNTWPPINRDDWWLSHQFLPGTSLTCLACSGKSWFTWVCSSAGITSVCSIDFKKISLSYITGIQQNIASSRHLIGVFSFLVSRLDINSKADKRAESIL